jgi:hypothetical protein
MICDHDASCRAICESYWGDCNGDKSDGCETPIKHRLYCDGDPRATERTSPSVVFEVTGASWGPGKFDLRAIDDALERGRAELMSCYAEALASAPATEGTMAYALTLSEGGCLQSKLLETSIHNPQLEECVARLFGAARFSRAPVGGPMSSRWDLSFDAGGELLE